MTVVVVMGVSGSGKSTVGALLAEWLGVPFADGDDFHPAANIARMRAGVPLDDADRASWLDRVAAWMAAHRDGGVVSCSALRARYRERLRLAVPEAFFLHLVGTPETLAARLAARGGHFMPAALLRSQLETLEALAPGETGAVVDIEGTPRDVAVRALAALPGRPPASSP